MNQLVSIVISNLFSKQIIVAAVLFICALPLSAQISVTGNVTDNSGSPVPGANVVLKGTIMGTVTDVDGKYTISVPDANAVLVYSFIGYAPQEIVVGDRTAINVTLAESTAEIEEVVVVGYGTQKRSEITASVASLTEEKFNMTAASSSAMQLVKGKIPGLQVSNANGTDPRAGTDLQIRGATSTRGSNAPLVVIDGVPAGDISMIPAEDVESFSVLKDASAAAIYGTRGSNGVILVTTKRGKAFGEVTPTLEYTGYMTHEYIYRQPEVLTATEYRDYMKSGGYLSNMLVDNGYDSDWMGLLSDKSNYAQVHNLSLSGGSRATNYRGSVFYREFNPIAIESDQANWGTRLNLNHKALNDRLDIQLNLNASFRDRNHTGENSAWEQVAQRNPTSVAKDSNGEWVEDDAYNSYNPLRRYETKEHRSKRASWLLSSRASLTVVEGLKLSMMTAWQQSYQMESRYYQRDSKQSQDARQGGGEAQKWASTDNRQIIELTADYTKGFEFFGMNNSVNLVAGHSYEYHVSENFDAWSSGFLTDAFKYNNLGNGTGIAQGGGRAGMGSGKADDKLAGFFGRVNYTLQDRYMLSATVRVDGSSKFGKSNRWGTFPSISGGWIMSKETFMQNIAVVNYLKLRLGYGVTGNMPNEDYLYMATLETGGQYMADDGVWYQTYGPARNPNPNLKWEEKREINFGIDYSLLNDRISGSIDVYRRKTVGLIDEYNTQLPPFVRSSIVTNVGTMKNSGIELGISAQAVEKQDFRWTIDATFYYVKNILESYSSDVYKASYREWYGLPAPGALGNAIRTEEGEATGAFYGKRFAGFDEQGKWLFYNRENQAVTLSEIGADDLTYIGNGTPRYFASLTNTFAYKGFDLSIMLRGKFSYDILNLKEMYFGNPTWFPNNVLKSTITKHKDLKDAPQYSDYYLEPGDFVKLDNLTLGYNFNFKNKVWVKKCRIYVSGENLFTITKYTGTTPEQQDTGLEPGIEKRDFYPVTSTLLFGLSLGF